MTRRMRKAVTSGSVISTILEAKEFAEKLPGRVNRVLDSLAASELKMKVELIDDGAIIDGLQKVANRITLGLILAAMIVARRDGDARRHRLPHPRLSRASRCCCSCWPAPAPRISRFKSSATTARATPVSTHTEAAQPPGLCSTSDRIAAAQLSSAPDPRLTRPKGIATLGRASAG